VVDRTLASVHVYRGGMMRSSALFFFIFFIFFIYVFDAWFFDAGRLRS